MTFIKFYNSLYDDYGKTPSIYEFNNLKLDNGKNKNEELKIKMNKDNVNINIKGFTKNSSNTNFHLINIVNNKPHIKHNNSNSICNKKKGYSVIFASFPFNRIRSLDIDQFIDINPDTIKHISLESRNCLDYIIPTSLLTVKTEMIKPLYKSAETNFVAIFSNGAILFYGLREETPLLFINDLNLTSIRSMKILVDYESTYCSNCKNFEIDVINYKLLIMGKKDVSCEFMKVVFFNLKTLEIEKELSFDNCDTNEFCYLGNIIVIFDEINKEFNFLHYSLD